MKIICIGRNYADHAKELKNEIPTEPVFFLKPDSSILPQKRDFFIPDFTKDVHYEVEVLVKINRLGKYIEEKFAHKYYNEIGLGIDFTARDIQAIQKQKGLPWEKAKAFDGSAVIGEFYDKEKLGRIDNLSFSLFKNSETVQKGHTADMIFNIDQIIAYVSQFFTLKIGDIIFTGTPAGVGPVAQGDVLKGELANREAFSVNIK